MSDEEVFDEEASDEESDQEAHDLTAYIAEAGGQTPASRRLAIRERRVLLRSAGPNEEEENDEAVHIAETGDQTTNSPRLSVLDVHEVPNQHFADRSSTPGLTDDEAELDSDDGLEEGADIEHLKSPPRVERRSLPTNQPEGWWRSLDAVLAAGGPGNDPM